ncbi:ATPase AAA [Desulfoluna limicola]|uniref:ATPase AAA n=1 Tax=Desulfoluna limicola TaxID=2810562 RepID=A0ABN6EYK2_9BACT|nr:ATPase AAA [Desulfoluna limicola]
MGHLTYALESGEGFVEITGEVGTGKTTLLRTFLEGLDDSVAVACIFNPTLNAVELLQSINRDFGTTASSTSRSDLTASLQRFLIENREAGKKALLVIDEAQNLSIEVMEELRLLSNLETTRTKLLQTVLCGQPELGAMLERYELRQLAQRISLSCRLRSLSRVETHRYIAHRVVRASLGDGSELFTKGARELVYRYSAGTPRVINICCDRALLCAYVGDRKRVDRRSVKEAVAELSDRPYLMRLPLGRPMLIWGGGLLAVAMLAMVGLMGTHRFLPPVSTSPVATRIETPAMPVFPPDPVPSAQEEIPPEPLPMVKVEGDSVDLVAAVPAPPSAYKLSDLFDESSINGSVVWGMKRIMKSWGHELEASKLPSISDPYLLFLAAAAPFGMEVMPVDENHALALSFNLPALVLFSTGGEQPLALVYEGEGGQGMLRFHSSKGVVEVSEDDVKLWAGRTIISCANPLGFSNMVTEYSPEQEVIALESALTRVGLSLERVDGVYDEETKAAVQSLQASYGIATDGRVGALTRVALSSALKNGLPEPDKELAAHDQREGEMP